MNLLKVQAISPHLFIKLQAKILIELTKLMTFPRPACDFHLCQIIDENVGTWWLNVIDIIRVVVIKCCKWTEVSDSFRYAQC